MERSPCSEEANEDEHREYIRQIWEDTEAGPGSALDHANHRRHAVVYESAVLGVRDYLVVDSFRMVVRHARDIDGLCPEIWLCKLLNAFIVESPAVMPTFDPYIDPLLWLLVRSPVEFEISVLLIVKDEDVTARVQPITCKPVVGIILTMCRA